METDKQSSAVKRSLADLISESSVILPGVMFFISALFGAAILRSYFTLLGQGDLLVSSLRNPALLIALGLAGALVIVSLLAFTLALPLLFRAAFNFIPSDKRGRPAAAMDAAAIFSLIVVIVTLGHQGLEVFLGLAILILSLVIIAREFVWLKSSVGGGLRIIFIVIFTFAALLFAYPLSQWLMRAGLVCHSKFLFGLAMIMLVLIPIVSSFLYTIRLNENEGRSALGVLFLSFFIPAVMVTTGALGPLLPVTVAGLLKVSPGTVEYLVKESDYPRSVMLENGFSTEVVSPSHYVLTAFSPYWVADVGILCPKEFELHKLSGGEVELAACLSVVDTSIFSPASMKAVLGRKPDPVHSDDNG
ncbi:hypothetical protein [Isoalcanivorax beigongshangi]|uniref:Uncharacterized protein n=1 Tax=Isoalcanivorax beigongshangi TaxID=3238810 RepID=A0ABV4AFD2_9GAMM